MADSDDRHDPAPSKSQLKRDAHAQQRLGEDLLSVPESDWHRLQLPENLMTALREAKKLSARGARKRQLQFIGKLMREVEPAPIHQYFDERREAARRQVQHQHAAEHWRERILHEGDEAIEAWLSEHPGGDRQHLRQLLRQARKEQAAKAAPKSSRTLFRYLRDLDEA